MAAVTVVDATVSELIRLLETERPQEITQFLLKQQDNLPPYVWTVLSEVGWNAKEKAFKSTLDAKLRSKAIRRLYPDDLISEDQEVNVEVLKQERMVLTDKKNFNLLLLGAGHSGKSALGEALLRKTNIFSSSKRTTSINRQSVQQGDYSLTIYDTPGIHSDSWKEGEPVKHLLATESFDLVFLVMGDSYRPTKTDVLVLDEVAKFLPVDLMLRSIIVMTRGWDFTQAEDEGMSSREAFKIKAKYVLDHLKRKVVATNIQCTVIDTGSGNPMNEDGDSQLPDGTTWRPTLFDLMRRTADINASIALFGFLNAGPYQGSLKNQKKNMIGNIELEIETVSRARREKGKPSGLQLHRLKMGIRKVKSANVKAYLEANGRKILFLIRTLKSWGGQQEEGIFRLSANALQQKELMKAIINCKEADLQSILASKKGDNILLGGTIKAMIREAQPPSSFMNAVLALSENGLTTEIVKSLVDSSILPTMLKKIWASLIEFCVGVSLERTKMSLSALATCLSISMIQRPDLETQNKVEALVLGWLIEVKEGRIRL